MVRKQLIVTCFWALILQLLQIKLGKIIIINIKSNYNSKNYRKWEMRIKE